MMAAREQSEAANREAKEGVDVAGERGMKGKDWSRAMVGWLEVLAVWMWDSPKTVKEFLSEGANLQVVSFLSRSFFLLLEISTRLLSFSSL